MAKNPAQPGIKLERDMYAPVKAYLQAQGWEVKAEVSHCDIAAVQDGRLLAAEMKLTLNLDVILQGIQRQGMADLVYLAVPKKGKAMSSPRWGAAVTMLQRLNLGLLIVSNGRGGMDVEELLTPEARGEAAKGYAARMRKTTLREFRARQGDYNTGGATGLPLITAYRQAALRLARLLQERGPQSAKELKPEGEKSRGSYTILRGNHYGWFRPVGGGRFDLTDIGRAGLVQYSDMLPQVSPEDDVFAGTMVD
jgi:hypothetical protein